ncbi:ATP-binding cassette domain-containing protein [Spiroplasma sp. AdecLV25b]|uniref:ATP-binding cassette domain-containing protein n=1 Tax=Spiroplasma sp. AdecLV25b TaxID=3027162 RepID=UPI0027DFCF82|nr:ATP-binding cassette domain-containing protein [Spiroplasma sp. AdecLV25b]
MLQVKNLTKKYQKFLALDNINFTLKKGEILGLVGDNGAGKTTLINCILVNVKTVSGQIFLNKIEIEKNHKDCLKIIFMPDLMGVTIDLTIKEYVSYLAILKKEDKKKALAKLVMALNELGFEKDLVNKKISNLSAGQKKKVFLCDAFKFKSWFINFRWTYCKFRC